VQQHRSNIYALAAIFASYSRSRSTMDVILVVGGIAMFLAGIAYTYACERL
jgi:hypothetical protein